MMNMTDVQQWANGFNASMRPSRNVQVFQHQGTKICLRIRSVQQVLDLRHMSHDRLDEAAYTLVEKLS